MRPAETVSEGEQALDRGVQETAAGFKFNGRTYRTQAQAENAYRTLQGELNAERARAESGVMSAHSWKAEADRLRAELEARSVDSQGRTEQDRSAAESTQSQGLKAALNELLDPSNPKAKEVWQIAEGLYQDEGPLAVHHFLMKELTNRFESALQQMFEKALQPWNEFQGTSAYLHATTDLFEKGQSYVTESGAPAYPELQSEKAAHDVGYIWSRLKLSHEDRVTPEALHMAISIYRDAVNSGAIEAPPGLYEAISESAEPPAEGVGEQMVRRAVQRNKASASLSTGRGTSVQRPAGESAQRQSFVAGIREAGRTVKMGNIDSGFLP